METKTLLSQHGIWITIFLIMVPLVVSAILVMLKAVALIRNFRRNAVWAAFKARIQGLSQEELDALRQRQAALEFSLQNNELGGTLDAADEKGLINGVDTVPGFHFIETKKRSQPKHDMPADLVRLVTWFLGSAVFWLVFGTTVGEYLGIKFSAPDIDHAPWLSFGRLRPVHTNAVFWGWASIAMIGLAYYVVSRVCNVAIYKIQWGYQTLIAMNTAVAAAYFTPVLIA